MEGVISCAIAAVGIVAGVFIGGSAYQNSWIKDCTEIGMHRTEGLVFKCEPMKREK